MINGNAGGSANDVVLQYLLQRKDNGRVEDGLRLMEEGGDLRGDRSIQRSDTQV